MLIYYQLSFAQNFYKFHENKIYITREISDTILVELTNSQYDLLKKKDNILGSPRFLIKKNDNSIIKALNENIYKSDKYKIEGKNAYILPKIAFALYNESNEVLDKIKSIFEKQIKFSKEGSVYYIDYPFDNSEAVLNKVSLINNIVGVKWCEPDILMNCKCQNTLFSSQYYLKNTGQNGGLSGIDINVEPAWAITQGNQNIVVAVIDQGVDKNHEDLLDRVLDGYTIGDASSKGSPKNANSIDQKAHGIACAGIIAASDNNVGIKGIASNVKILPINIVPGLGESFSGGFGTPSEIASAIRWAYKRADILNCSWVHFDSNIIEAAFDEATQYGRNLKGCVIVASSGNSYDTGNVLDVSYPAKYENIISVGAIKNNGAIWDYSQRGISLDLVAPSGKINKKGDVVTLDRMGNLGDSNGNYVSTFGGTSASCPQVAGVAALMLSVNPDLTAQQVRNILQQTARDLGPTGFDTTYGYGLVNAGAAVSMANILYPLFISGPTTICSNGTYTINGLPSDFTVNWRFTNNALIIASGQGTTTLNVSKNSDSKITLYADIKNNGSTVTTLSKEVFVGTPMLGMMINPIGADGIEGRWCEGMAGNKFTIEGKSAVDAYDYLQVKIYKLANNGTKTLAYTNNNFLYGLSIPYTFSNGFYELQVRGVKDCGTSQWLIGQVSATSGSGGGMFPLDMQISYDPSAETLNVTIMEDEGGDELQGIQASINNNTKTVSDEVYDVQLWSETAMVRHFTTTDSCFTISMNGLKRGTYILRVSKNGKIVTKKVIK